MTNDQSKRAEARTDNDAHDADSSVRLPGSPASQTSSAGKPWNDFMKRARGRFGSGLRERDGMIDLIVRVLLIAVVASGCYLIIEPFLTAILLAAVIAVATWPIFDRLRTWCGHRATPAALLMVGGIVVIFLIPLSFFLIASAQRLPTFVSKVVQTVKDPQPVLETIRSIPYVGSWLHEEILQAIDPASFGQSIQKILDPLSSAIINTAVDVSNGLMQLALVTFIVFFFYRDGAWFADRIRELLVHVSGGIASEICDILVNTTRSVVYGLIGTAICQGLVAGIGFWIAGVPGVLILSATVCILSVVPIGPPLVWIPAAVWLYAKGSTGMAVFLFIWGAAVVSSVDNLVKPLLISRGSTLPLALIFLGVFGGVIAFGFLGLILGPLLLAIGLSLFQAWLKKPVIEFAHRVEHPDAPALPQETRDSDTKH